MSDAAPPRVLVIRLGSLGDLVHTLPAVAALRASLPNAESEAGAIVEAAGPAVAPRAGMDWVVEEKWAPLIQMVAGIDRVIPIRRSVAGHFDCVHRLRQERYACAVDFQGLYKSALLAWRSGAPRRLGFDRKTAREPGAAWFYTECVTPGGRHMTQLNASLAMRAGARPPVSMHFPIHVPGEQVDNLAAKLPLTSSGDPYIVVSPGGGWKSKCWPPERYGELCGEIWRRHGIAAVVNAGPGEDELGAAVIRASSPAKPALLSPSLVELCALVKNARIVIAADTGPLHLAAALGTRVIALFGPTDPARNGPIYEGGKFGTVLRNVSDEANSYKRGDDYSGAMLSLTVEQVVAAVERELGAGD